MRVRLYILPAADGGSGKLYAYCNDMVRRINLQMVTHAKPMLIMINHDQAYH